MAAIAPSAAAVVEPPVGHSERGAAPGSAMPFVIASGVPMTSSLKFSAGGVSVLLAVEGASVQSRGEHIVVLLSGQSLGDLPCVEGSGQLFGGQVKAGFVVTGEREFSVAIAWWWTSCVWRCILEVLRWND